MFASSKDDLVNKLTLLLSLENFRYIDFFWGDENLKVMVDNVDCPHELYS